MVVGDDLVAAPLTNDCIMIMDAEVSSPSSCIFPVNWKLGKYDTYTRRLDGDMVPFTMRL